ncbi:hypothetical protein D3C71_1823060 [compost metagenome]
MDALHLEIGLRVQHAVVHQVLVGDGVLVAVVVAWSAVAAVEQFKGVVVDVVGWRGSQAKLNGIKVVKDGLVALVDGSVTFVGHDQVVVTH